MSKMNYDATCKEITTENLKLLQNLCVVEI